MDFPEEVDYIDFTISRTARRVSLYIKPFLVVGREPLSFKKLV